MVLLWHRNDLQNIISDLYNGNQSRIKNVIQKIQFHLSKFAVVNVPSFSVIDRK